MQLCSKCHTQSPDSANLCSNCQANLAEFSETAMALRRMQVNPRVKYVRLVVDDECCPACQEAEGAYPKENPPHLPVEGCSHALGCRCFYQPFLNDIYP